MIRPLYVLYPVLLIVCIVTGIVCTRRLKFKFCPIKLLPWFILLTLMSELTALWTGNKNARKLFASKQLYDTVVATGNS